MGACMKWPDMIEVHDTFVSMATVPRQRFPFFHPIFIYVVAYYMLMQFGNSMLACHSSSTKRETLIEEKGNNVPLNGQLVEKLNVETSWLLIF